MPGVILSFNVDSVVIIVLLKVNKQVKIRIKEQF